MKAYSLSHTQPPLVCENHLNAELRTFLPFLIYRCFLKTTHPNSPGWLELRPLQTDKMHLASRPGGITGEAPFSLRVLGWGLSLRALALYKSPRRSPSTAAEGQSQGGRTLLGSSAAEDSPRTRRSFHPLSCPECFPQHGGEIIISLLL